MTAHAAAARCSSTDDPVAISELLIGAPDHDTGFGAVRGLGFIEHDVGQRLTQFDSLDTLRAVTGLPVLGAVSATWLDRRLLRKRSEVLRVSVAGAALMVVFVAVVLARDVGSRFLTHLAG